MTVPLISVVMSVFNGEKYLADAVDSVLAQTFCDFEFVIVDDGSTDRTAEVLDRYDDARIRRFSHVNKGLSKSLNRGVEVARGTFIARMDADDVAHKERLQVQSNFLLANPTCVVVGSNANFIAEDGSYLYTSRCLTEWRDIQGVLPASPHFHSSTMFRRDQFLAAGGYYDQIPHFFEDQILWNRLAKVGELRNVAEVLLDYRLTPGSITADKGAVKRLKELAKNVIVSGSLTEDEILYVQRALQRKKASRRDRNGRYWLRIGKIYLEHNFSRRRAFSSLVRSIAARPSGAGAWFNLLLLLAPRAAIYKWKLKRGVYARVW